MPPQCVLLQQPKKPDAPVSQADPPLERGPRVREAPGAERHAAEWQTAMSAFDSELPPSTAAAGHRHYLHCYRYVA